MRVGREKLCLLTPIHIIVFDSNVPRGINSLYIEIFNEVSTIHLPGEKLFYNPYLDVCINENLPLFMVHLLLSIFVYQDCF